MEGEFQREALPCPAGGCVRAEQRPGKQEGGLHSAEGRAAAGRTESKTRAGVAVGLSVAGERTGA